MANKKNLKELRRQKIHQRIRRKVIGTPEKPRLSIKKTGTAVYVQVIDDTKGHTLIGMDTRKHIGKRMERVEKMSEQLLQKLRDQKIQALCYDRSGYLYHGIVKRLFEIMQQNLHKK